MPRPKSLSELLAEDDQAMSGIPQNIGEGLMALGNVAKTVSHAAEVYNDIQDAVESVDRATSKQTRTSSEAGLCIEKDRTPKVQKIVQTTPVGHNSLAQVQTGIGSSGTQVIGNNTAPPIQLKLGKQLGPTNSVANFLSLMSATGSCSVAFGGRLRSDQDIRVRTYQCYRHNLHADNALTDGGSYPTGSFVMYPSGSLDAVLTGGNAGTATLSNTQIRDIDNGSVYFSQYNKPDLEDLSFNLNKFKLGPETDQTFTAAPKSTIAGGVPKIQLLNDEARLQPNDHRAFSAIYQNNTRTAQVPSGNPWANYQAAPYTYDAVLKQGTVDYMFMNKGESPCEVELIVYRIKKNGVQGVPSKFTDLDLYNQLEIPITTGMMRKTLGYIGTDAPVSGSSSTHIPNINDWIKDPSRPFLPKNRFVDQSETPYVEENRVKLTLQSGQRRPFQLKLGGIKYDPSRSVIKKRRGSASDLPEDVPIYDEHSFIVCIALNGIAMSRQLSGESANNLQLTAGPIIGDCFAPADLQWYAQYTEHVGAMAYKKVRERNIFTFGAAPPMRTALSIYNASAASGKKLSSTPVALLTQAQAVRVPQTPIQTQSTTGYTIGTQSTQASTGGDPVQP